MLESLLQEDLGPAEHRGCVALEAQDRLKDDQRLLRIVLMFSKSGVRSGGTVIIVTATIALLLKFFTQVIVDDDTIWRISGSLENDLTIILITLSQF